MSSFILITSCSKDAEIEYITETVTVTEFVPQVTTEIVTVTNTVTQSVTVEVPYSYEFARAGKDVTIEARKITIDVFDITAIRGLEVDFEVKCNKGTYIRSLAHDFGKALKSGGHLSALRRTSIGDFSVNDAMSIENFIESLKA